MPTVKILRGETKILSLVDSNFRLCIVLLSVSSKKNQHFVRKKNWTKWISFIYSRQRSLYITWYNSFVTFVDCLVLNFSISTKDMMVPWTTFRLTGAWHRSLTYKHTQYNTFILSRMILSVLYVVFHSSWSTLLYDTIWHQHFNRH